MAIPRVERRAPPRSFGTAVPGFSSKTLILPGIWGRGGIFRLSQLAGFSNEPEMLDRESVEAARRAVELDPTDADAHAVLGEGLGDVGEAAEAEAALDLAVTLNPSSADILARYAGWAPLFGKPEHGAEAADRARLLNPSWPELVQHVSVPRLFLRRPLCGSSGCNRAQVR